MNAAEKQIHNERVKLRANALNTGATSAVTVGVLAPIATTLYNVSGHEPIRSVVILGMILYLLAATWLHRLAQDVLGGLVK